MADATSIKDTTANPAPLGLLAFGMTPVYARVYQRTDGSISYLKALLYAHLYVIYEFHWSPAGWNSEQRRKGFSISPWGRSSRERSATSNDCMAG